MFKKLLFAIALAVSLPAFAQKADILEVITIEGVIQSGTAQSVTEQVEKINENAKVKAVLLIVDTPGGGVIASSVIYEELSKLKVPVVAWCMNLCASGGVYVVMAPSVKHIAVRTETIGGSVGVISQVTRFNRLLDWAKIDNQTFKSGKLKDAGNPTRAADEEDNKYLQAMIDSLAAKFYTLVDKARGKKISAESWVTIKTARIFFGSEIVAVGLADAVATREEVVAKAKELSGSKNIYTREELKKMSAQASESSSYSAPVSTPSMFGDVPFLIELVKEVRAGEKVKFEYRMPYSF